MLYKIQVLSDEIMKNEIDILANNNCQWFILIYYLVGIKLKISVMCTTDFVLKKYIFIPYCNSTQRHIFCIVWYYVKTISPCITKIRTNNKKKATEI